MTEKTISKKQRNSVSYAETDPDAIVQKAMETYGAEISESAHRNANGYLQGEMDTGDLVNSAFRHVIGWIRRGGNPKDPEHLAAMVKKAVKYRALRGHHTGKRREEILSKSPENPRVDRDTVEVVIEREFELMRRCEMYVHDNTNRAILLCLASGLENREICEFLQRKGLADLTADAVQKRVKRMREALSGCKIDGDLE